MAEADEGHFDGKRQVSFGAVLRTDHGYMGQARGGSQAALFGCVGVYVDKRRKQIKNTISTDIRLNHGVTLKTTINTEKNKSQHKVVNCPT